VIFNGTFKGGPVRLFVQDLAGGDPKPIGPPGLLGQVVSPDGRSIVAAPWGEALMRYSLDGASPTPLKGVEKGEHAIRWSADGHSLFVASTDGLVSQITAVDLTTGHRKPLWHITPADPAGASPAFGVAVSGDGRSYAYTFFRNISDMYLIDGLR
jgi:dipeptidyl aminopeptidase/acylaminoacyl peptidase